MPEDSDPARRFLPRIRRELDKLPLTDEQKDALEPEVLQQLAFIDTNGFADKAGCLTPESTVFAFDDKMHDLVERFREDGLTAGAFLRAVLRRPQLLVRSPETVAGNVTGVVGHFAADGLTRKAYLRAAVQNPSLFGQSPETTAGYVTGVVERFASDGLTRKAYLQAALKQPTLFTQSPETVAGHITGVVDRFADDGLTRGEYLNAALKQPSLFGQCSETVAGKLTAVVERFAGDGLTTRSYIRAALKQPTLFYQSPETIIRHIDMVVDLYDRGFFRPTLKRKRSTEPSTGRGSHASVIDYLLANPAIMCLADENFGVREVHQRLTDGPTDSKFLDRPRHAVESALMSHLGHSSAEQPVPTGGFVAGDAPPTEEQARRFVLRALIHAGYIKGGSSER